MARSDTLKAEIAKLKRDQADATGSLAKQQEISRKATAAASKKRADAARTKSDSTRRTAESAANREEKKAADATKKAGDIQKKLASVASSLATKERSLASAIKSEQGVQDRADEKRRRSEKDHAREIARLSAPRSSVRYVAIQPAQPEKLRVLYLSASPEGEQRLRVDREVREVQQTLRGSRHRDLVDVEYRPAATAQDVIDGLNDIRPHVVHFSGHGDSLSVVLESGDGQTDGAVEFSMLARVLGATDTPPALVVLNACESLDAADELLKTVPVVIGMSDSITDTSAIIFAARFYAGIASAQSLGSSLEQAKAAMAMASLDSADLPQAKVRDDVDLSTQILVKPVDAS